MFASSSAIQKKFYQKDEVVFEEGDVGDSAFIVETGSVGIFKIVEGERVRLADMNEGELFGEMAVIDGSVRMANARALEESVIIQIPRSVIENKLDKYEPFMKSLVQILVENLRSVHQVYMHRPRSVNDYINAITYHSAGFRDYLETVPEQEEISRGLAQLDQIDATVKNLRQEFEGYQDMRSSVLTDVDIAPQNKGDKT